MRRQVLAAATVCCMVLSSCGDDGSAGVVTQFTDCVEDGGGTVADDVELAVDDGRALAVVGGGVQADDELVSDCLVAASRN